VFVRSRYKDPNEKRGYSFIKANDKLRMLGIIFSASHRAATNKGPSYKHIRIYLSENPEHHDYYDLKRYDRRYINLYPDYRMRNGVLRITTQTKRGKRKSQIVRV